MTTRVQLKNKIENLIDIKEQYENALKNVELLRKQKSQVEEEVTHMLHSLNMEGKTLIVNNQKVIQKNISVSQSLTFKYIEDVLEQYNRQHSLSNNKLDTKELLKFIKNNRPKYMKTEIKID